MVRVAQAGGAFIVYPGTAPHTHLGVAVRNVLGFAIHQRCNDVAECRQRKVDLDTLLHAGAGRLGLGGALAACRPWPWMDRPWPWMEKEKNEEQKEAE